LNWMEGNSLFTYMTLAMLPEYLGPSNPGEPRAAPTQVPHAEESLRQANETLARFPIDRVLRPVMNSLRTDIELNPNADRARQKQAAQPVPIDQRPRDNEYEWKGNPYRLDGWLKPTVVAMQFSCDDSLAAWFADSSGRVYRTLDGGNSWHKATDGLMSAAVQNLIASERRSYVVWAQTEKGVFVTRDGGLSWRPAAEDAPTFAAPNANEWLKLAESNWLRVNANGELERSTDGGKTTQTAMKGWRIPRAQTVLRTPRGVVASGPGGAYESPDGETWSELKRWREEETGAADFLHAYWMGRYYGFVPADASKP